MATEALRGMLGKARGPLVALVLAHLPARALATAEPGVIVPSPALDESSAAPTPAHAVVVVAGTRDEAARLEAAIRELAGRIGVEVTTHRIDTPASAPPPTEGEIRITVDLTRSAEAEVRSRDKRGAELERRVAQNSSRAILIDETAHVVQAALESLLAEPPPAEPIPPPPPAPAATAPTPQPPRAPQPPSPREVAPSSDPATWGTDLAAFVSVHSVSASAPVVPGVGAGAHVGYRQGQWRPGGWLLLESRFPYEVTSAPAAPVNRTFSLRVVPTFDVARGATWAVEAGLGAGLDRFVVAHVMENRNGDAEETKRAGVRPAFTALCGARLSLVENVQLTGLGLLDFDPAPPNLEVRHHHTAPARSWRLVPGILIGLSFTLFGKEPMP